MNEILNWMKEFDICKLNAQVFKTRPFPDHVRTESVAGVVAPADYFMTPNYTENVAQAFMDVLHGKTDAIVVGGNGSQVSRHIIETFMSVAVANQMKYIYTSEKAIAFRPALSLMAEVKGTYGILVHSSGSGVSTENNVSITFVNKTGGPCNNSFVKQVVKICQNISEYEKAVGFKFDFQKRHNSLYQIGDDLMTVSLVDMNHEYLAQLRKVFDFNKIHGLLCGAHYFRPFRIHVDCSHGSAGQFTRWLFEEELGAARGSVINYEADDRVQSLNTGDVDSLEVRTKMVEENYDMGVAMDSDGGRCVLFGRRGFHVPKDDTLAVIAAHCHVVPYFQRNGFNGVAKSFFTSRAAHDVADNLKMYIFECPENWRNFNKLMAQKKASLCGDADYGIGSIHGGDKDALFTILAWLSVIVHERQPIREILINHWAKFGRRFKTTFDMCCVPVQKVDALMTYLGNLVDSSDFVGSLHSSGLSPFIFEVESVGKFQSESSHKKSEKNGAQGYYIQFTPKEGRVTVRTTKSSYFGKVTFCVEVKDEDMPLTMNHRTVTAPLAEITFKIAYVETIIGRKPPEPF